MTHTTEAERETRRRTIANLVQEEQRTHRAIDQLEQALSSQGMAMRRQLIHRAGDVRATIRRLQAEYNENP